MMKILVADSMHESLYPMLESAGFQAVAQPGITREKLKEELPACDGLIIRSKTRVDEDLLQHTPGLKVVARAGAGIDNLDEDFLLSRGIEVINAPEGNRDAVGEHCLGMLLSLLNHLRRADMQVRQFIWDREGNRGHELNGKTVALIGYGNMGMTFARKLSGLSCKVLAYDKYKSVYGDKFAHESSMDIIHSQADIVSLHIPLTEETKGMVDLAFFQKFTKPVYFLNTARGGIVRLSGLVESIKTGLIRGAGLDVLENEKLDTLSTEQREAMEFLISRNDVLFSPHVGGWSYESYVRINEVLVSKLTRWRSSL